MTIRTNVLRNGVAGLVLACAVVMPTAQAATASKPAPSKDIECKMDFDLQGWSVFYQTAEGSGHIHCSNGQSMNVHLKVRGGGITFGKSKIAHGHGSFTGVSTISELKGSYAKAEAHAGAGDDKSAGAQAMTKGRVSLALDGTGSGWNLGVAFGAFIIE